MQEYTESHEGVSYWIAVDFDSDCYPKLWQYQFDYEGKGYYESGFIDSSNAEHCATLKINELLNILPNQTEEL